jgi:hypothetical protein
MGQSFTSAKVDDVNQGRVYLKQNNSKISQSKADPPYPTWLLNVTSYYMQQPLVDR